MSVVGYVYCLFSFLFLRCYMIVFGHWVAVLLCKAFYDVLCDCVWPIVFVLLFYVF